MTTPAPCAVSDTGLQSATPDAYELLGDAIRVSDNGRNNLWARQKRRQADVSRTARRLIGELGFAAFSVHELAQACHMSRQTIYNLVGDRELILRRSIGEHKLAIVGSTALLSGYPNQTMGLIDLLWSAGAKNPGYMSALTRTYHSTQSELVDIIRPRLFAGLMHGLEPLERSGQMRLAVRAGILAQTMLMAAGAAAMNWVDGEPVDRFRRDLISNVGMVLLGAVRGSAHHQLEEWLDATILAMDDRIGRSTGPRPGFEVNPSICADCRCN